MVVLSRLELYNRDQKDKEKYLRTKSPQKINLFLLRVQDKNIESRIRDCPVD